MLLILLKSAACLAVFMVFYKLFLERENMHQFKRFYLLAALVISFAIPFITFIKYVEPTFNVDFFEPYHYDLTTQTPMEIIEEPINYLPIILWSLYGLGVLLFGIKFGLNLFRIISRINKNEKQKQGNFITVLLRDLISPHTFFSYIFLNKSKFETKAIPQEVLLHEAAHAKQKHSLDVLFIELLQVAFWFNPLLYFIKKDIKLNHEFLADEAVLKHGIDSSTYQNTLLAFSTNVAEPELANAINYSLIKKRFTIMKTQTSKRAVWLRSLLLLPLLGGLLFSFSSTKEVEKDVTPAMVFPEETKNTDALTNVKEELAKTNSLKINYTARSISINVFKNGTYEVDGIKANKNTFKEVINQLHQDITPEIRNNIINIHVNSPKDISDKEVWFIYNSLLDYGFYRIVAYNQEVIRAKGNKPFAIESNKNSETKTLKNSLKESVNFVSNAIYTENQKPILIINGIVCDQCELYLSKKGVENIILATTTGENILSFKFKVPGKPTVAIKGHVLNTEAINNLNTSSLGSYVQLFDIKTVSKQKLSPVVIKLVDKNAKNYSHSPVVKKGEKSSLPPPPPPPAPVKEYNKMKAKAKAKTTLPPPPPPPAPPKSTKDNDKGPILINGETYYFSKINGTTKYYNRYGIEVDSKGNKLSNKQTDGSKVVPGQKISKVYKDDKVISEFKKTWKDDKAMNIPQPPKPISRTKLIENMTAKNADFFYNEEKISAKKAMEIVKNNNEINIASHSNNGNARVHLSTEPINDFTGRADMKQKRAKVLKDRKEKRKELLNALENNLVIAKKTRKEEISKRQKALKERKKNKEEEWVKVRKELITARDKQRRPLAEQFKGMEAQGSEFFFEGKKISEDKAIALIKENPKLNVSMHVNNGKGTVHLSKKGIKTVNGKIVKQMASTKKKENPWVVNTGVNSAKVYPVNMKQEKDGPWKVTNSKAVVTEIGYLKDEPNLINEFKRLDKNDAIFYFNKKEINLEKAIEIYKTKKDIIFGTSTSKSNKPIVYLLDKSNSN